MAKISIDFSDVKAPSFSPVHQAPGVYNAVIADVEMTKTKSDNTDMLVFTIGAGPGRYPYYCKIVPNQLWKLRELVEATGTKVPNRVVQIDPSKYVGAKINIELEDDTYNGKLRSRVARVAPFAEVEHKVEEVQQDVEDDFGEFDDIL